MNDTGPVGSPLHRAVQSAERVFDGARRRVRDLFASHDQPSEITPYRTYGTPERLEVRGRVLVRRSLPPPESTDSWLRNVRRTVRSFLTYEMPDVDVTVERRGERASGRTDEEGYFRIELPIQGAMGWTQASVHAKGAETVQAQVLVPPPTSRHLVISDIDDTLLPTGATRTATLIRTTLLGNAFTRAPFPGIAEFFSSLVDGAAGKEDNPIFYVSSSPWNLYPFMTTFFAAHGLPVGPVILRDFGVDRQSFIHGRHEDHKLLEIRRILDTYVGLACVLVGDSGQRDPEIYAAIATEYPDRVRAIYVREIGEEARFEQVKSMAADLPVPLISSDTTDAFHDHARLIGLIGAE